MPYSISLLLICFIHSSMYLLIPYPNLPLFPSLSRLVISRLFPISVSCPSNSPGKNTAVDCHALLQDMFPTQESNQSLLHCRQILYYLSHQGIPNEILLNYKKEWNSTVYSSVDGPREYYGWWNKSQRNINTILYQLLVESKK